MRLAELAAESGVSIASIKFWIREGILPPGEKITATSADYGTRHLERIAVIRMFREDLRVPLAEVAELVALIDDPAVDLGLVQERCQVLVLGLHRRPAGGLRREHRAISELCATMGWPDTGSWAREELAAILHEHPELVPERILLLYARGFDEVARENVRLTSATGSRDRVALETARGVALILRLERAVSAMAHSSASILRHGGDAGAAGP